MNPLRNLMPQDTGRLSPPVQNIAEVISFAQSFKTPEAFMAELSKRNPHWAQQIYSMARTVKDPIGFAMQKARESGIDPNELMRVLRGI